MTPLFVHDLCIAKKRYLAALHIYVRLNIVIYQ